jgi:hypothetical protein
MLYSIYRFFQKNITSELTKSTNLNKTISIMTHFNFIKDGPLHPTKSEKDPSVSYDFKFK